MSYKFHDFICSSCNTEKRDACWAEDLHKQKCECGGDLISEEERSANKAPNYIPFKEGWYEHFDIKPIYIKSKKELKQACEKYNMGSVYRDDM